MSFQHIPNKNHNSENARFYEWDQPKTRESGQYFEIKKPRNYLYEATPEWPKKGDLNYDGYPDHNKWIAWRDAKMKSDDADERTAKNALKIHKGTWTGGKRRTRKSRKSRKSRKTRRR